MHDDGVPLGNLFEDVPWTALRIDKILGDNFEPVDGRPLAQDVRKVHGPQSDSQAQVGMSQTSKHSLETITSWGASRGRTFCPLGDAAAMPTIAFVKKFRKEFEDHLNGKPCPYAKHSEMAVI